MPPRWDHLTTEALFRELRRHEDPALRDYIIEKHEGLVRHVVKEYSGSGESFDDLMGVGHIGLINAVDRFDPARRTKFATFAVPTIKGEIRRHFRDRGWHIKVPRRLQELALLCKRAVEELTHRQGSSPTYAQLAQYLGRTEDEIIEGIEIAQQYEPLSMDAGSGNGTDDDSTKAIDRAGDLDRAIENVATKAEVEAALRQLPQRERDIIRCRHFEGLSQTEVADRLGISQMHVSRLEHRARHRLRQYLEEQRRGR
jgi:RNA polymerase sigma-B factor